MIASTQLKTKFIRMKIYKKHLLVIGLAVLSACKKNDSAPLASAPVADPYARFDNTSSEIEHQVYLVYQQTQIPILYNDTLSKNPLKKVNLNYQLSGPLSDYIYSYPKTKADILSGIYFVKNSILPPLGKIKVYSISLLDTLKIVQVYGPTYSVTTNYKVINGLTTIGIANVPAISTMTTDQLKSYKAEVLTNILINPLVSSGTLGDFYKISAAYYGKYVYGDVTNDYYLQYKDKREYGFVPNGTEYPGSYQIGDQTADLKDYLAKVLSLSASEFQTQYGSYPLVMSKYNFLKIALAAVGFDLTKV